jgi:hypothetical protein
MRNPLALDSLTSLVAAPTVWTIHFVVCYGVVSLECALDWKIAGWIIALATAGALVLIALIALSNYRKWRHARNAAATDDRDAGSNAFFSMSSMLLCGISAITLIWVAYPAVVLPTCAT